MSSIYYAYYSHCYCILIYSTCNVDFCEESLFGLIKLDSLQVYLIGSNKLLKLFTIYFHFIL